MANKQKNASGKKLNDNENETIYIAISRLMDAKDVDNAEFNYLDTLRDKFKPTKCKS